MWWIKRLFIIFFLISIFEFNLSYACDYQDITSCFVDRNKDNKIKIAFIGDSFIKGVGDVNDTGGYVARLKKDLKETGKRINIVKIARPGATTKEVLTYLKKNLYKKPSMLKKIYDADAIIIDLGRNDYWDKRKVIYSITILKRLIKYLKNNSGTTVKPFITASTLVHVNKRYEQLNFIKAFNAELLNNPTISGEIQQHSFPVSILGDDGLHPTALGYTYIYKQIKEQMTTKLYEIMLLKEKNK